MRVAVLPGRQRDLLQICGSVVEKILVSATVVPRHRCGAHELENSEALL